MKRMRQSFSFLLFLLLSVLGMGRVVSAADEAPLVVGYYPYWATQPSPQQIPFQHYTHLIHAFVMVDEQGRPAVRSNVPDKSLTAAAHAAGVKVLLGLGGGSNGKSFTAMVRDEAKASRFIREIVVPSGRTASNPVPQIAASG